MPVLVIEDTSSAHCGVTWPWLDGAAAWGWGGAVSDLKPGASQVAPSPQVDQQLAEQRRGCTGPRAAREGGHTEIGLTRAWDGAMAIGECAI